MEELLWIGSGIAVMIIAAVVMDQSFPTNLEENIEVIYWPQLIVGTLLFIEGFWIYKASGL